MRDAKLPFRESPVDCALLSLWLQPVAGLEEGMGPLPTNCLNLVPVFRVLEQGLLERWGACWPLPHQEAPIHRSVSPRLAQLCVPRDMQEG